jgi:hypothetical protein
MLLIEAALRHSSVWIFRDGKERVCSRTLIRELQQAITAAFSTRQTETTKVDALIRAGELESSLADEGSLAVIGMAAVTDALASHLVNSPLAGGSPDLSAALGSLELPETLTISPPEGFAYYALHPVDFAEETVRMAKPDALYAVVGTRNIGSTLSAMAVASLKHIGKPAERITVRPGGDPYERNVKFSLEQVRWVQAQVGKSANFLIVDEGPGLSGSSFLCVGEALADLGVPSSRITFVGTREPDVNRLLARNARDRWHRFGWRRAASVSAKHFAQHTCVGGGSWRTLLLKSESEWPAAWTGMERAKFVSADRRWLFKFEGLGRFGQVARARALQLSSGGFCPEAFEDDSGFSRSQYLPARPLVRQDLSPPILGHIAKYCAFRAAEFRAARAPRPQLGEMVHANLQKEFGDRYDSDAFLSKEMLLSKRPIIVDGRMQPHEWLMQPDGRIWKTDAVSHGDDHFFPGPTDIAWDLAGAVVEWNMDRNAADYFLARYSALTGDRPESRLPEFLLAYAVFRMSYCKMAADAEAGSTDEARLRHAYRTYRAKVEQLVRLPALKCQHNWA